MTPKNHWRIDSRKTAFVTIDLQNAWLMPGSPKELPRSARQFIPKVNEAASICRMLSIPVIHVYCQVRADLSDLGLLGEIKPRTGSEWEPTEGKRGVEFYAKLDILPGDYAVKKIRYSAFIPGSSSLDPLLRGLGRDSFITCGVATDICVGTTVADAMMLGFRVFLVSDLTTSIHEERQRVTIEGLNRNFAKVITFENLKKELKGLAARASVPD